MNIWYLLIDISEDSDVNETRTSKECFFLHHWGL